MLVQGAWAASRTKGTYLSEKYRRLSARIGKKKALIAIARTMLVSIYHIIKNKEPYKELGSHYLENLNKEKTIKRLKRKIESFGYLVLSLPNTATQKGEITPIPQTTKQCKNEVTNSPPIDLGIKRTDLPAP